LTGERAEFVERDIVRHRGTQATADQDVVPEEIPVALVYNGIAHAVMMATPRDLEEFAVGFSLTSDIYDQEVVIGEDGAEVQITIAQPALLKLKGRPPLAGQIPPPLATPNSPTP
jgi:FdhD protein